MDLPVIPPRAPDAHKGDFGRILVVGGSRGMPGAAALAAWSALKAGAGLVKVAAPLSAVPSVAAHFPCYTLLPCPETDQGTLSLKALPFLLEEAGSSDVIALGPGISVEPETADVVFGIVEKTEPPLVIDADGLNILAKDMDRVKKRRGFCVLTPHPGEFTRLDGGKVPRDEAGRINAAKRLAQATSTVVLLKGKGTVVTDGNDVHVTATGNPGMATAGSGDVLTGVIASLLLLVGPRMEAVALGAHLHGLAGDLAAEKEGEVSVTALDILHHLSPAIQRHQRKGTP